MIYKPRESIREHLTVLLRHHSVIALCCGIATLLLSFYGIIASVNRMTRAAVKPSDKKTNQKDLHALAG